jgi:hypothetical protein
MGRGERNRDQKDLPPLIFKGRAREGLSSGNFNPNPLPLKA